MGTIGPSFACSSSGRDDVPPISFSLGSACMIRGGIIPSEDPALWNNDRFTTANALYANNLNPILPRRSTPKSTSSSALSTSGNVACMQGWSPRSWVMAVTAAWRALPVSVSTPFPRAAANSMASTLMATFVSRGPDGRWWKKKDPAIWAALEQLLQEDTAGDPSRRLKWKRQSLNRLSELLGSAHPVSAPTVARLLREMDFSPKVNRKQLAESSPYRDEQFRYLRSQKRLFLRRGWPVLSIDTKKRELIGWFKNPGTIWCRDPIAVNAYDFPSLAEGVAIPAGMYDLARNEGFVMVGTSANTAEFTVDALSWWWREYGHRQYPKVSALLLLADGGGSNGYRVRLWKYSVQRRLVNPTGLQVTVCHYPTGASKWNPVEHRLFGEISTNWAGQPLINYQRVLAMIRGTTTKQGLVVHAMLNEKRYATKIKISDEQMQEVQLYRHRVLPQWNYTIKPTMN
jgi:hypothetical protein